MSRRCLLEAERPTVSPPRPQQECYATQRQHAQAEKDHLQAKNDYEVNLKAELEIMQLHEKFNELRDTLWVELMRVQQQQIEMLEQLVTEDGARNSHPERR